MLSVITVSTVGRFAGREATQMCYLHRLASVERSLPNLPITRLVRCKVNPSAISRPIWDEMLRITIRSDFAGWSPFRANDKYSALDARIDGQRNPFSVRRPPWATSVWSIKRGQLK